MSNQSSTPIQPLTDHIFGSWFVDTRVELRKKKLWKYTQEEYRTGIKVLEETINDTKIILDENNRKILGLSM